VLSSSNAGADYVVVPRTILAGHVAPVVSLFLSAVDGNESAQQEIAQLRETELDALRKRVEVLD